MALMRIGWQEVVAFLQIVVVELVVVELVVVAVVVHAENKIELRCGVAIVH